MLFCVHVCACVRPFVPPCAPRSCHQLSRPVFLVSLKPASWLIRAGFQPPWLHFTISHRATYSIISCLNWRALLSLTQADRKFPFISCIKLASCTQTDQACHHNANSLWLQAEGAKSRQRRATQIGRLLQSVCATVWKRELSGLKFVCFVPATIHMRACVYVSYWWL